MAQQTRSEIKRRDKKPEASMPLIPSLPYLAIVVPKAPEKESLLALPAYWLQPLDTNVSDPLPPPLLSALTEVLTESLLEDLWICSIDNLSNWQTKWQQSGFKQWAEKQFLPGVTDNLAHVVEEAFGLQKMPVSLKVASGTIYLASQPDVFAQPEYKLYHPVVERFQIHDLYSTEKACFSFPAVSLDEPPVSKTIKLDVSDEELLSISKSGVLALTLEEMLAIKHYYTDASNKTQRAKAGLSIWPTDAELEVIAQTWSEHCKHKIFGANISMQELDSAAKEKEVP